MACNCSRPHDPGCCDVRPDEIACRPVFPKSFYCTGSKVPIDSVGAQGWVYCCDLKKIVNSLSVVLFKTQTGRDSVFNFLKFDTVSFDKNVRLPAGLFLSLNSPEVFDVLCSIASAASFKDRLSEKTHFRHEKREKKSNVGVASQAEQTSFSFADAATAFRKNVPLLGSLIPKKCRSRAQIEGFYQLTWVNAGTPIISTGDTPYLATLNSSLMEEHCFNLWMPGSFVVTNTRPVLPLVYGPNVLGFPVFSWDTVLPCDGFVSLIKPDGTLDVLEYHYVCRKFTFTSVETIRGDLSGLLHFLDSARQFYNVANGFELECGAWLDTAKEIVRKRLSTTTIENLAGGTEGLQDPVSSGVTVPTTGVVITTTGTIATLPPVVSLPATTNPVSAVSAVATDATRTSVSQS